MKGESMISKLLGIRRKSKKKKPDFGRQEGYRYKRLGNKWRRPRGRHSKLRAGEKPRGKKPSPGYSSPPAVRGLTASGHRPVIVANKAGLQQVDSKRDAVVISSSVGRKKRLEIAAEAERLGLRTVNAYRAKLPGSRFGKVRK